MRTVVAYLLSLSNVLSRLFVGLPRSVCVVSRMASRMRYSSVSKRAWSVHLSSGIKEAALLGMDVASGGDQLHKLSRGSSRFMTAGGPSRGRGR